MRNSTKQHRVVDNFFKKCYSSSAPEYPGSTTVTHSRPWKFEMTQLYSRAAGAYESRSSAL
jgi:hypothetical protein